MVEEASLFGGPVPDDLLRSAFDLARMGPTSANCQPMRVVFVRSAEAKAKFAPALSQGNLAKTMAAQCRRLKTRRRGWRLSVI